MDTESMLNTINAAMTQCRTARRDRIANSLAPVAVELRTRLDAERRVSRIGERIRLQSLGADGRLLEELPQTD